MKRETELQMMLQGTRPMSAFYRATSDLFDEKNGQNFSDFVKSGKIRRTAFYVKNVSQDFVIFYTIYTLAGEEWRAKVYKTLKKIGQNVWNEDLQRIEEILFKY